MYKYIKPLIIFVILVLIMGGVISKDTGNDLGLVLNFLFTAILGLLATLIAARIHFLAGTVFVIAAIAVAAPKVFAGGIADPAMAMVILIGFLGAFCAKYISQIMAFLILCLGLGLALPPEAVHEMQFEPYTLVAAVCAALITPIMDTLTTRRKRLVNMDKKELLKVSKERSGKG